MNTEIITMLLGFAALVGVQIRTTLALIARMDRQGKEISERIDRETTQISERIDRQAENTNTRFDDLNRDMNKRFDEVNRELADQRERMAKLEGSLEGFLAGRRDRDAA